MNVGKIKTKKKVIFRQLISPDLYYFGWANLELLFEFFKWMAETGDAYNGMKEALSGKPTCTSFDEIDGFSKNPLDSLIKRFSIILNSGLISDDVYKWKQKYGVSLTSVKIIPIRYKSDGSWLNNHAMMEEYNKLFEVDKKRAFIQPQNDCHPECTLINGISFNVTGVYWNNLRHYAYEVRYYYSDTPEIHYTWNKNYLSGTEELFSDFCKRVNEEIRNITDPVQSGGIPNSPKH